MALYATRADLEAAIARYTNRGDLTDDIPSFIALGEARIARVLREVTTTVILALVPSQREISLAIAHPLGGSYNVAEPQSLRLYNTGSPSRDTALFLVTPAQLAEVAAANGGVAGRPTHYAVVGDELWLAPAPDQAYDAEFIFYEGLDVLDSSSATNSTLTSAPDLYLYSALAAAEPFLMNDERMALWKDLADEALKELAAARSRKDNAAGPRQARLPAVF